MHKNEFFIMHMSKSAEGVLGVVVLTVGIFN